MGRRGEVARALVLAGVLVGVAACAPGGGGVTVSSFPPGTIGPGRTAGAAAAQTRIELVRVLGEHNLVLQDSEAPFRPPEDTTFTTTPRALYQVILPDAPSAAATCARVWATAALTLAGGVASRPAAGGAATPPCGAATPQPATASANPSATNRAGSPRVTRP